VFIFIHVISFKW